VSTMNSWNDELRGEFSKWRERHFPLYGDSAYEISLGDAWLAARFTDEHDAQAVETLKELGYYWDWNKSRWRPDNGRALPQRPEGAAVAHDDEDRCDVCGDLVRFGARHRKCGDAMAAAEKRGRESVSPPASAVAEPVAFIKEYPDPTGGIKRVLDWRRALTFETPPETKVTPLYSAPHPAQAATVSDAMVSAFIASPVLRDQRESVRLGITAALASSPAAPAPVIPESEKGR